MKNISKPAFLGLEFALPPKEEQFAVAAVLSEIGDDIAALERRRDKMRLVKHGMMQQLLTGRVRLVASPEVSVGA